MVRFKHPSHKRRKADKWVTWSPLDLQFKFFRSIAFLSKISVREALCGWVYRIVFVVRRPRVQNSVQRQSPWFLFSLDFLSASKQIRGWYIKRHQYWFLPQTFYSVTLPETSMAVKIHTALSTVSQSRLLLDEVSVGYPLTVLSCKSSGTLELGELYDVSKNFSALIFRVKHPRRKTALVGDVDKDDWDWEPMGVAAVCYIPIALTYIRVMYSHLTALVSSLQCLAVTPKALSLFEISLTIYQKNF